MTDSTRFKFSILMDIIVMYILYQIADDKYITKIILLLVIVIYWFIWLYLGFKNLKHKGA